MLELIFGGVIGLANIIPGVSGELLPLFWGFTTAFCDLWQLGTSAICESFLGMKEGKFKLAMNKFFRQGEHLLIEDSSGSGSGDFVGEQADEVSFG